MKPSNKQQMTLNRPKWANGIRVHGGVNGYKTNMVSNDEINNPEYARKFDEIIKKSKQ